MVRRFPSFLAVSDLPQSKPMAERAPNHDQLGCSSSWADLGVDAPAARGAAAPPQRDPTSPALDDPRSASPASSASTDSSEVPKADLPTPDSVAVDDGQADESAPLPLDKGKGRASSPRSYGYTEDTSTDDEELVDQTESTMS